MRILVRTSNWALWARRLGSFAVPLIVVPIFMHRAQQISSATFFLIGIVAALVALAGFIAAIVAFVRLWFTGDRGWGKAALGFVLSLVVLGPVCVGVFALVRYPPVNDVSTDLARPPPLTTDAPRVKLTNALARQVAAAFPNAASRTYPVVPQQVFSMVEALARARGWQTVSSTEPAGALGKGQLNAISLDLIGWRDEISIRVEGVPEGATVSMRSASLAAGHDLGTNGNRIEEFLLALDNSVTILMRDAALATPEPEPTVEEEAPPPVEDEG
jgi:hypothetical protein